MARRTVFDVANRANDRASAIEARLGHPHRKPLVIRCYGVDAALKQTVEDVLIEPRPLITNVSPRLVGLQLTGENKVNAGITVSANDLLAEVSRSYPKSTFLPEGSTRATAWTVEGLELGDSIEYLDPINKKIKGGQEYRIIHVDDRDCCVWKLILRRLIDG